MQQQLPLFVQHFLLPPVFAAALYRLLCDVVAALDGAGLPYWVDGGLLIGLEREHGRMLMHDDDVDLAMESRHWKRLPELVLQRLGSDEFGYTVVVDEDSGIVKIANSKVGPMHNGVQSVVFPTVELFEWTDQLAEQQQPRLALASAKFRDLWPQCWLTADELMPLKRLKCIGPYCESTLPTLMVTVPSNSFAYLDRLYPGWKENVVIDVKQTRMEDLRVHNLIKIVMPKWLYDSQLVQVAARELFKLKLADRF